MSFENDPDYEEIHVNTQDNQLSIIKNDAKEATIKKIAAVINTQFNKEIELKENELNLIEQNLQEAHYVLDQLRTCIVTKYYLGETVSNDKGPEEEPWIHPTTKKYLGKAPVEAINKDHDYFTPSQIKAEPVDDENFNFYTPTRIETENVVANLLKVKKTITIVVGNISKYIPPIEQAQNDQTTHKWMVYVRLKNEKLDVKKIVKKVILFLHPSYKPNDLVELRDPPFYLCRRGWGEFPIRVQVHFQDPQNKPIDIIHNLKLDQTFTGLQTLGGETVADVSVYLIEANSTTSTVQKVSSKTSKTSTDIESTSASKTPTNAPKSTPVLTAGVNQTSTHSLEPQKILCEPVKIKEEILDSNLNQTSLALPRAASKPATVSLLKKNPQQTYKIVMIQPDADSKQVKYFLCPSTATISSSSKAVSILSKNVKQEPSDKPLAIVPQSTWKSKALEHRLLVKKHFGSKLSNYESMSDFMLDLAKFYPLCNELPSYPYCSKSYSVFNSWNVGKQRASEWFRAKTMERVIDELLKNEKVSWRNDIWSPKKLLLWCRASGFIPPFYTPVAQFEILSDNSEKSDLDTVFIDTVKILKELEEKKNSKILTEKLLEAEEEDIEILEITENPKKQRLKRKLTEMNSISKELFFDKPMDDPEVFEELYTEICTQFMVDVVHGALLKAAESNQGKPHTSEINIHHIYQSVTNQSKFDILTNKYLGIEREIE